MLDFIITTQAGPCLNEAAVSSCYTGGQGIGSISAVAPQSCVAPINAFCQVLI